MSAPSPSNLKTHTTSITPINEMIYQTTYKKGNLMQKLHFKCEGGLTSAIAKVKAYCYRHHLMHIHTVPFLVNLDEILDCEDGIDSDEVIDISK